MAKRNVMNIVNKVKIDERYDMSIDDMFAIKNALAYSDEPRVLESIAIAFKYGYAMGQRAEKNKNKGVKNG